MALPPETAKCVWKQPITHTKSWHHRIMHQLRAKGIMCFLIRLPQKQTIFDMRVIFLCTLSVQLQ